MVHTHTQIARVGKVLWLVRIPDHRNPRLRIKKRRPRNPPRALQPTTTCSRSPTSSPVQGPPAKRTARFVRGSRRQGATCRALSHPVNIPRTRYPPRPAAPARKHPLALVPPCGNINNRCYASSSRHNRHRHSTADEPPPSQAGYGACSAAIRHHPRHLHPQPPQVNIRQRGRCGTSRQRSRRRTLTNRNRPIQSTHRRTQPPHARRTQQASTAAVPPGSAHSPPPTAHPTRAARKAYPAAHPTHSLVDAKLHLNNSGGLPLRSADVEPPAPVRKR